MMIKKLILTFFILVMINQLKAQVIPGAAIQLADHIAQKMKDTLGLTQEQRNRIYDINLDIVNQKIAARQQYSTVDSVSRKLQHIENQRDTLYHAVLPENKYQLYKQKKMSLIRSN